MPRNQSSRRQFLKKATAASAGALSFPYFVPSSVLGKDGAVAPSNRIVMGCIGTGGKGTGNMKTFMRSPVMQIVAVCDVETPHRNRACNEVNKYYKNKDCKTYPDFRDICARQDIDAMMVGTPDHWHGLASIQAVTNGKDVYCEKPLTNTIGEGRALADAVKKYNRVLQTGSQERSGNNARYAAELVQNGRIGKLHTIEINLPCNDGHHNDVRKWNKVPQPEMPIPEGFDYNFWVGPTPAVPYTKLRCHFYWRFILNYGGGEMTDRGAHVIDAATLIAGVDRTGPVEISGKGSRSTTGLFDTFMDYEFEYKYANGLRMVGASRGQRGAKLIGDKGWIFIHIHGGKLEASDPAILKEKIGENEIHVARSPGHHQNFIESIQSRKQPVAEAEIGHRSASLCHLANIAMVTGKTLKWDPETEKITNDEAANSLVTKPMRAPWHL